jgi:hypothetical protein
MSAVGLQRRGDWMQTYSGRMFWPLDPEPSDVDIVDIAHSLAHQCRFAGHCTRFYSVAEHSVRVAELVFHHLASSIIGTLALAGARWGLMHDASEAYLVDLPRPVKRHMPAYRPAEDRVMAAICARFGLPSEEPEIVKWADNTLLATEARDIMGPPPYTWNHVAPPLDERIEPWSPEEARSRFMSTYHVLFDDAASTS